MRISNLILRSWYYFRTGDSTYLVFLLGIISTLITVHYLAIKSAPELLAIFPHFETFAVISSAIGLPLAVIIGWAHLKQDMEHRAGYYYGSKPVLLQVGPWLQ
jgi:hypothetical protein